MFKSIKNKAPKVPNPKYLAVTAFMNRYSLLFHVLLACSICFLVEWVSRHSFLSACYFVVDRNLVFLYNSLIVFASLMLVYTVRRRMVMRILISVFWLFLGIINGCILAKRVTPFSFTDIKMVGDLFTMQSNYFTMTEAVLVIAGVACVILLLVLLWFKGPKYQGKSHRIMGVFMTMAVVMMLPGVTNAAVSNHILTDYFENLAQGYKDYGFVYSFSSSVLDRGMSTPDDYSEESIQQVLMKEKDAQTATVDGSETGDATLQPQENVKTAAAESLNGADVPEPSKAEQTDEIVKNKIPEEEEVAEQEYPNIICILLESFVDPELVNFLQTSEDAVPNFHYLYENYSSGYLEVPVVGAGTANTEFEILTGMGMQFFGLGEYPYKTILKDTNCESIASDLHTLGFGTHVVHDNGGNFYSRRNAFSMMGFDTFTSKEMMDIQDYTPLGTWPQDDIMVGEVEKALDYTEDSMDFVYTITVESHGDYPKELVIENPEITVSGVEDEGMRNAWEYYVNQVHNVDDFVGDLITMLAKRDEKTLVVMFGDHLPTMGLTEDDMATGSLFKTQYATWNNFGMEKKDQDLKAYQLLAEITSQMDIHNGTMFKFHQNRDEYGSEEEYQHAMELLQYDILYGDHYVYNGKNPYPASDLQMGTQDIVIKQIMETDQYYYIIGDNFTKWSRIFVNGSKISTSYCSGKLLRFKKDRLSTGLNKIVVNQMGSSDSVFRSSNQFLYNVAENTDEE